MSERTVLWQHKIAALEKSQAIMELTLDGRVLRTNDRFLSLMGYSECELLGQPHSIFVAANETQTHEYADLWKRLRIGEHSVGEFLRVKRSGELVWIHGVYCPLLDARGRPYRIMKVATDITERKRRDADFAGQVAAIRMSQAIVELDLDGKVIDANTKFLDLMGYRLDAIKGRDHSVFVEASERDSVEYRAFWWRLRDGNYHAGLYKRLNSRGEARWLQATYNPVRDEFGRLRKIVKIATDQTSAVEDHLRVEYLYRHDVLTGLANRAGLKLALDAAFNGDGAERPTLLLIDLDRLKCINDTLGHPAGDHCLTIVASRIKEAALGASAVARLGGDEFAVLLSDPANAERVAEQIIVAASEPFEWLGGVHQVSASIGISSDGNNPSDLLHSADIALYEAKGAGRATFRKYRVLSEVESPDFVPTDIMNDLASNELPSQV